MNFPNPYLSPKERIELLQRWIIVHSIIYYELGNSIISDKVFDANSLQLVEFMKDEGEAFRKSYYYKIFYDFDGSTGFDLYSRLSNLKDKGHKAYLMHIAQYILRRFGR